MAKAKINCVDCANMVVKIPLRKVFLPATGLLDTDILYNESICRCVEGIQRDVWNVGEQFKKYGKIIGTKSWERDDCIAFDSMD